MTLEDFFTVPELKDGLTTPVRVNELLAVMQKEKDSVLKNVDETIRQWSAVANTIAATVDKECLDLFIQLEGLWFIDRWLNDAQKFGNDMENSFLEELIVSLLRALDSLQVDNDRSVASGIGNTVERLLSHSSSVVREKAKTLCDGWTVVQDIDTKDAEKMEALGDGTETECPSVAISPCRNDDEENVELTGDRSVVQQAGKEEGPPPETIKESATVNLTNTSVGIDGNLMVNVEIDKSKYESIALTGISGSTPTVASGTCEEQSDVSQLDNKHVEDEKEKQEINAGAAELTALSLENNNVPPSADVDVASEHATKTETREETSPKDEDMMDGVESPEHHHSPMQLNTTSHISDSSSESDNPKTPSNTDSDEGGVDAEVAKKDIGSQSDDDSGSRSRYSTWSIKEQATDLVSKRPSDMELDYGIVDPLELARQVANEVEIEADSQERSCSSSQNISDNSPDSENEERNDVERSKEISSSAAEPVNDVEKLVSNMESGQTEIPPTEMSKKAPECEPNVEKGFSGFDLNEEVSSEEVDCPVEMVSVPISVVSASRATVADGLPVAPLQFEGTLGWKGSAATSAFRRLPEVEKTFSSSSSPSNSKHRLDRLDFDLNVAEASEDKVEDLFPRGKMAMAASFLPSAEASPLKLPRVQLDLNSVGDGDSGTIALDWKREGRIASLRRNGPQSPSVSSSSSSIQPSFRNIDLNLNDHSAILNNASLDNQNPFLSKLFNNNASGGTYKRDESVISIFGTQFEVKRKDAVPSSNGRIMEPTVDFSLGRAGSGFGQGSSIPYANLPAYGQNSYPMGPAMNFTSPMYGGPAGGPIPCIVDSRGTPFVPQIMGTPSSIPPAFSQPTQQFLFNMGASGSNGAGPSRHNLDLNSGLMSDGGNRENNGGLRQFFVHNQGRGVDEQYLRMGSSLQGSSSSVMGGKRQEPEGGWEAFPINYNYKHHHHHQQPPPWQ